MTQRFELELSPEEITTLNDILNSGSAAEQRRARIILMTADAVSQVQIASEVGLSERQVRRWQRAFQKERMTIFPDYADAQPVTPALADMPTDPALPIVPWEPAPSALQRQEEEEETAQPAPPPPATPPAIPGVDEPRLKLKLRKKPGANAEDTMSEAGRKILHYHFERMLLHEPGSRLGEDIEAVHDMRVATRRMRSAFRVFSDFYRKKTQKPLVRGLRRTASLLGDVRDMDVFLEKLDAYADALPPESRASLQPLVEECQAKQAAARDDLIAYLNSGEFSKFVQEFERFTTTPGLGSKQQESGPAAYQVRHVVPRLIYARYGTVRAYETVLDHASIETLHALRIDFKRLRYTVEFFAELLGDEGKRFIDETKRIQDHLGDLNDANVAGDFLREFISRYEQEQVAVELAARRSIEQVVQYMAFQFSEKHRLMVSFPEAWENFNRYEVRRDLGLAVAAL